MNSGGGQQRVTQLPERPSVQDIKDFMTAASKESGTKFTYAWKTDKGKPFSLAVKHVSPTGRTCEWHMYSGAEANQVELWFQLTDNTMRIYDAMLLSIGENIDAASRADGLNTFTALPVYQSIPAAAPDSAVTPPAGLRSTPLNLGETFDSLRFDGERVLTTPMEETLKGNLTLVHITNLLQSIGLGQMSGRLRIKRNTIWADIFFEEGSPVHAEGTRGSGEDCFLQVVCWMEGDFEFEPKLRTKQKTIVQSLESLILEGVLLHDNTTFLTSAGIRMNSVLTRIRPNLSEIEFEQIVKAGAPSEARTLKNFYLAVDGQKTIEEIITKFDLLRSAWVPICADLIRCNLVKMTSTKKPASERAMHGKAFDANLAESVKERMVSAKTGIYSYAAFLLLLTEILRCSHDTVVSVMVLDVQAAGSKDKTNTQLSEEEMKELAWRIDESCNFKGIVAHYDENEFAVILPGLAADKAARRADRLLKSLVSTGLQVGSKSTSLIVSIGIACHPHDANDLGALLAEADRAREKARKSGSGISLAKPPSM